MIKIENVTDVDDVEDVENSGKNFDYPDYPDYPDKYMPDNVVEFPRFLMENSQDYTENRLKQRKKGVMYATDLTKCPLKKQYALKYPEVYAGEDNPAMMMGRLIHLGLQSLLKQEYPMGEIEAETTEIKGTKPITGHVDFLMPETVYEIKSTRYFPKNRDKPYESHVRQVREYMNYFEKQYGMVMVCAWNRSVMFPILDSPASDNEILRWMGSSETPRYQYEAKHCIWRKAGICKKCDDLVDEE